MERLVDSGPYHERSWTARWVTDTGSTDYKSAFAKLVMYGEQRAGLEYTGRTGSLRPGVPAERRAAGNEPDRFRWWISGTF